MADTSITREERYLEYLTGNHKGNVPKPVTRRERYLYELCLKGMGGEISPEEIKNAVNEYLEKNPVKPGATTEQAQQIEQNKKDVASLKESISTKITKFYASSQGETHLTDSDNGKIMDMMLYGKSSQDETPSLENPVEIKSVVNPTVKVCGKNLFTFSNGSRDINGVVFEAKDGIITAKGTATRDYTSTYFQFTYSKDIFTVGETYTFSINSNDNNLKLCAFYKANDTSNYIPLLSAITKTATVQIPENVNLLIRCVVDINTTVNATATIQIEKGSESTTYEPYHEQTATLPYDLYGVKVPSGGNVTIDGQQYIADYVERGKLVRMTELREYDGTENWDLQSINNNGIANFQIQTPKMYIGNIGMCDTFQLQTTSISNTNTEGFMVNNNASLFIRINTARGISTLEAFKEFLANKHIFVLHVLRTPTEIDLAEEEITAFKTLATYYPTTNISVNSEQLDGYTVFNYPISMENGWNYVKKQLNDNRDYIYDMDVQSAEAYVNSEYAVALTELEV